MKPIRFTKHAKEQCILCITKLGGYMKISYDPEIDALYIRLIKESTNAGHSG
jgi:hypothetical protein